VIDQDGYCTQCGARAKSPRDHYTEAPYPWAGGTCDIGLYHRRNEDALAILASPVPGERAALVVCDGVTTSTDSDVASLAGARAACRVLYGTRPEGLDGLEDSHSAAMMKVLRDAVRAADEAVIEATAPDSLNPASATFAAALVERTTIYWANLGDSRVYWFPDAGSPVQLSQDHSLAQVQIDEGVTRETAEASVLAHTITKWLGRDAVDPDPALGELEIQGPGWLLVCSDGLWNYASGAGDLGAVLRAITDGDQPETVPLGISGRLVDWANAQGGHDNITAAVARLEVPDPAEI
jgi:serine/threonine protein phosphatase PrpC